MMLTTRRLLLRDFREDDWPAVLEYQSDPGYLQYYAWTERSEADVQEMVQRFVGHQAEKPRTRWQLAVTLPDEGNRLIGNCGIRLDGGRQAEREYRLRARPTVLGTGTGNRGGGGDRPLRV